MDGLETQPTAEELAAAEAAGMKAFTESFESEEGSPSIEPAPQPGANSSDTPTPPAPPAAPTPPAPAPTETPAPAPADPYAALPEAVRKAIAVVPHLEHQLATTVGRLGAVQGELDRMKARQATAASAPAAPTPPPESEAMQTVRRELPEVASAIEDAVKAALRPASAPQPTPAHAVAATPTPSPAPADANDEELMALNEFDSQWAEKLKSDEFSLYLMTLPEAERTRIRTTESAGVMMGALSKFDRYTLAKRSAASQGQHQTQRAADAVQPKGAPAPVSATGLTPEEAFLAGFKEG